MLPILFAAIVSVSSGLAAPDLDAIYRSLGSMDPPARVAVWDYERVRLPLNMHMTPEKWAAWREKTYKEAVARGQSPTIAASWADAYIGAMKGQEQVEIRRGKVTIAYSKGHAMVKKVEASVQVGKEPARTPKTVTIEFVGGDQVVTNLSAAPGKREIEAPKPLDAGLGHTIGGIDNLVLFNGLSPKSAYSKVQIVKADPTTLYFDRKKDGSRGPLRLLLPNAGQPNQRPGNTQRERHYVWQHDPNASPCDRMGQRQFLEQSAHEDCCREPQFDRHG